LCKPNHHTLVSSFFWNILVPIPLTYWQCHLHTVNLLKTKKS
jgi:hypothetical protein